MKQIIQREKKAQATKSRPLFTKKNAARVARETASAAPRTADDEHPTILVVHASVGSGHKSAALAIAEAFRVKARRGDAPANLDVQIIDILDYGRVAFEGDDWASLFTGSTRPIYDLTWRYFLTGRVLWGGGTSYARIMFPRFTELVRQKRPLAIVCTHITGANAAAGARIITQQDFPIVCVPTDYETEGLWPHKACDLFCVHTESMAETLRARKINEERICITGIPTRSTFRKQYDKAAMRKNFQLPQDKCVVLALAGAYMPSPYLLFREALDNVLPYLHTLPNLHLVFVAGRDEEYARHVRRECDELNLKNVTVFEYVEQMAELMAASDAVVCKPGGLTVTECLCARTPMLLLGRSYGQEKVNVRMLTEMGAALNATTGRELLDMLRRVNEHPESLQSLLIHGDSIRRPHAAGDIADKTFDLIQGEIPLTPSTRKRRFAGPYLGHRPAHVR